MKIKQLILVRVKGTRCLVDCFERHGCHWQRRFPTIKGYIGKKGATYNKQEGDMKTPLGLFPINTIFGTKKVVNTNMNYMCINSRSRWCCDVDSPRYYNRPVTKRWMKNCEDMWRYRREYKLGLVISYNMVKRQRGKGSAIFLHCKNSSTAGCVAVDEYSMLRIAKWMNKSYFPCIFIKSIREGDCFEKALYL